MVNWKTAAGLGVAVLALGGLATWDEWQTKKEEKEKETSNLLITLKPDQVTGLVFYTAGDAETGGDKAADAAPAIAGNPVNVSAKLVDGKWQLTSPVSETADQQAIQDLIKNVTDYKFEKEIAAGKEQWAEYGLTAPRRKLELEEAGGQKTIVMVGINAPVGFSTYVATDKSDKVYAGSQYIATSLAKTLFDFRDKKIVTIAPSEVDTISYNAGKDKAMEIQRQDGKWQITAPDKVEGDTTAINNFLDDIVALRATEFIDQPSPEQLAGFSPANLIATVKLTGAKAGTRELKVGKAKDGTVLASLDPTKQVAKVSEDSKAKLTKTMHDFRNKKIFDFQSAHVETVQIDDKSFVRVKDDWYAKEDAAKFDKDGKFTGGEADKPKAAQHVRTLLVDLEYAKADAVEASEFLKKLPAAPKNQLKLDFAPTTNKAALTVNIWQAGDNPEQVWIHASDSSKVFKAKKSVVASMSGAPALPAEDASFPPPEQGLPGTDG